MRKMDTASNLVYAVSWRYLYPSRNCEENMKREGILDLYMENGYFIIVSEKNGVTQKYKIKTEKVEKHE